MNTELQVINPAIAGSMDVLRGMLLANNNTRYRASKRPAMIANQKRYPTQVYNSRMNLWMNSLLLKDEWEELDTAIVRAARSKLQLVADLVDMGLTKRLGSIGTMISQ